MTIGRKSQLAGALLKKKHRQDESRQVRGKLQGGNGVKQRNIKKGRSGVVRQKKTLIPES